MGCGLWGVGCGLWCGLWACGLWAVGCGLWAMSKSQVSSLKQSRVRPRRTTCMQNSPLCRQPVPEHLLVRRGRTLQSSKLIAHEEAGF